MDTANVRLDPHSTCAPCKHKAAVSTHLGRASFSVTQTADPCQRALYHYIALGRTMPAHCYRNNGDPNSEPGVEAFIEAQISVEPEKLIARCDANESTMDFEGSDDEGVEFDAELVAKNFSDAMNLYRDMILIHQSKNKQDPATNKSMMAMTKSLKKSMKCTPLTHQHQMHTFGKGTTSGNRTKKGAVIKVNPPAVASRKFKVPGRGPAQRLTELLTRNLKKLTTLPKMLLTMKRCLTAIQSSRGSTLDQNVL